MIGAATTPPAAKAEVVYPAMNVDVLTRGVIVGQNTQPAT